MKNNTYLANAFSLQMLDCSEKPVILVTPVTSIEVAHSDFESCIGHADTATVLSSILNREVKFNRASIKLNIGDVLYVAQIQGGRLPEGSTTLPEGFTFTFVKVELLLNRSSKD